MTIPDQNRCLEPPTAAEPSTIEQEACPEWGKGAVAARHAMLQRAVEESIATGEARTVKATSIGRNKEGEEVARFVITWSFKAKQKPNS